LRFVYSDVHIAGRSNISNHPTSATRQSILENAFSSGLQVAFATLPVKQNSWELSITILIQFMAAARCRRKAVLFLCRADRHSWFPFLAVWGIAGLRNAQILR
jgi:hypothetical protein